MSDLQYHEQYRWECSVDGCDYFGGVGIGIMIEVLAVECVQYL